MNLARKSASRPAHVLHSISRNAGSVLVQPVLFKAFKGLTSGPSGVGKDRSLRRYRVPILPASEINNTGLIKRRRSEPQESEGVAVSKDVPSVTTGIRELGHQVEPDPAELVARHGEGIAMRDWVQ